MEITGKITGIKYKIFLSEDLNSIDIQNFNINTCPSACLVNDGQNSFAVSKWVSPKRTRSYLYERVLMPSKGDIKDGLLKMILFSNLSEVEVNGVKMKSRAVLKLTSEKINDCLTSEIPVWDRAAFLLDNDFSQAQIRFIGDLLDEAVENGIEVKTRSTK